MSIKLFKRERKRKDILPRNQVTMSLGDPAVAVSEPHFPHLEDEDHNFCPIGLERGFSVENKWRCVYTLTLSKPALHYRKLLPALFLFPA